MCGCVNAIVGLIGMVERGGLWNRKGSPRDRRGVPSALPKRIAVLWRRLGRQPTKKGERMRECGNA